LTATIQIFYLGLGLSRSACLPACRQTGLTEDSLLKKKTFFFNQLYFLNQDFVKVILTEIQMMDIRKIPNLKMTNDKAQMSNQEIWIFYFC